MHLTQVLLQRYYFCILTGLQTPAATKPTATEVNVPNGNVALTAGRLQAKSESGLCTLAIYADAFLLMLTAWQSSLALLIHEFPTKFIHYTGCSANDWQPCALPWLTH